MPVGPSVGAPVHIVGQTVGQGQPLVGDAPIELAFDRLLSPTCITRQTFVLQDLFGDFIETTPSYDPVARVVRLCLSNAGPLQVDQTYRITILAPQNSQDPTGLQAIDGAGLDPQTSPVIEFQVAAGPPYTGPDACTGQPAVDFCTQILPIFASKCGTASCHAGSLPAEGLLMTTPQGIQSTAVGRVSQESNTGPSATTQPPAHPFNVDMPIIGATTPGDSWLMYKLLLAPPPACSSTPGAAACDAGAPGVESTRYPSLQPPWTIMSDTERTTLGNYIEGREMPYPADPSAPPTANIAALTADELDTVSTWIEQGAAIPGGGCSSP